MSRNCLFKSLVSELVFVPTHLVLRRKQKIKKKKHNFLSISKCIWEWVSATTKRKGRTIFYPPLKKFDVPRVLQRLYINSASKRKLLSSSFEKSRQSCLEEKKKKGSITEVIREFVGLYTDVHWRLQHTILQGNVASWLPSRNRLRKNERFWFVQKLS